MSFVFQMLSMSFEAVFSCRLRYLWVDYSFAMAETMAGFNCCCPLRCKGNKSLGKFRTHDEAYAKLSHHLRNSDKRWLEEEAAAEVIASNAESIWEEEVPVTANAANADEGTWEEAGDARNRERSRSRSRRDRSRGKSGAKGGHHHQQRREETLVRRASERVMQNVHFDHQEQKMKVFQFAKTLGKCEAVIKAATQVARQAVACFEDFCRMFHLTMTLTCYVLIDHVCARLL